MSNVPTNALRAGSACCNNTRPPATRAVDILQRPSLSQSLATDKTEPFFVANVCSRSIVGEMHWKMLTNSLRFIQASPCVPGAPMHTSHICFHTTADDVCLRHGRGLLFRTYADRQLARLVYGERSVPGPCCSGLRAYGCMVVLQGLHSVDFGTASDQTEVTN